MRIGVISYEASGRALEYSVALHRGDRSRFQFDVTNEGLSTGPVTT
jgi:DNA-binding GntR family transcriptional regulator